MTRITLNPWLFCCAVLLFTPMAAAQNDSDSTAAAGTYFDAEITARDDNDIGIRPDEDNDNLFGVHDCLSNVAINIHVTLLGEAVNSDNQLYLYVGEDCDDASAIADCRQIVDLNPTSETASFQDVTLSAIFEDPDCSANDTKTARLWLALLQTEDAIDAETDFIEESLIIKLDTAPPSTQVSTTGGTPGDGSFTVEWDEVEDADVEGFAAVVAESDADCAAGVLAAGGTLDAAAFDDVETSYAGGDITRLHIDGLENGVTYEVAVAALDEAGNPSALSNVQCVSPVETMGFGDGLATDGQYCFIATAVFGSYDHPTVKVLRGFRDGFLKKMPGGHALIDAYYQRGPALAGLAVSSDARRETVAAGLSLFAGLSKLLVHLGPGSVAAGLLLSLLLGLGAGIVVPAPRRNR